MSDKQPKPREFDAVLGGKVPPPVNGLVLGGIEGVKYRLKSTSARERAATLINALHYGEEGFNLLIEALKDPSEQVQLFAGLLLRDKGAERGRQALLKHNPLLVFTTLDNWKFEPFYPNIGIIASVCTAYSVNLYRGQPGGYGGWTIYEDFNLEDFQAFLKEPQVSEVEALACWMADTDVYSDDCEKFVNLLCRGHKRLNSLKALFIGDRREHEYKKSRLYLSNIIPILEAFPYLEVLKLHGHVSHQWQIKPLQHNFLKTLIVETPYHATLSEICALDLPALEYLEVWGDRSVSAATSILTGGLFPNLCYLGLPSFEYTDKLVEAIAQSPILARLTVLDISLGELTDKGAEILLKCPAINQLHTLNVAKNCLSTEMLQRLAKLNCRVIAEPQHESEHRYYALNE